jgi:hypothetical protein
VLKFFSVTPPEKSGGAENSTEYSGPHAKNFFCSMYESSLRHPVWVPEINVNPCNSDIDVSTPQGSEQVMSMISKRMHKRYDIISKLIIGTKAKQIKS